MVYRKGTYLQSFAVKNDDKFDVVFTDKTEGKYTLTEQNISLNPSKISGNCGRLMCCLKY